MGKRLGLTYDCNAIALKQIAAQIHVRKLPKGWWFLLGLIYWFFLGLILGRLLVSYVGSFLFGLSGVISMGYRVVSFFLGLVL